MCEQVGASRPSAAKFRLKLSGSLHTRLQESFGMASIAQAPFSAVCSLRSHAFGSYT